MPAQSPSFIAKGDIEPSVFVQPDPTNDHAILQAEAGDECLGVSHEGTREAPVEGVTPLAAKANESCQVYTDGWPCEIIAGATLVNGDKLKSDANGHAIKAVAGDAFYAVARAGAAAGERVKATVTRGLIPA
ncbi:hypothetical protein [Roseiconus lacunae]|uniref:hypothetical protein n=1 Tax=Roseiconus lacunae TaxID=2605694 RepID=UPI001E32BA09|nr:hypothetical protein [Roseiconus lacunae]MCD0459108.1 hypothetical protein [Roseiconus lacunae]